MLGKELNCHKPLEYLNISTQTAKWVWVLFISYLKQILLLIHLFHKSIAVYSYIMCLIFVVIYCVLIKRWQTLISDLQIIFCQGLKAGWHCTLKIKICPALSDSHQVWDGEQEKSTVCTQQLTFGIIAHICHFYFLWSHIYIWVLKNHKILKMVYSEFWNSWEVKLMKWFWNLTCLLILKTSAMELKMYKGEYLRRYCWFFQKTYSSPGLMQHFKNLRKNTCLSEIIVWCLTNWNVILNLARLRIRSSQYELNQKM